GRARKGHREVREHFRRKPIFGGARSARGDVLTRERLISVVQQLELERPESRCEVVHHSPTSGFARNAARSLDMPRARRVLIVPMGTPSSAAICAPERPPK